MDYTLKDVIIFNTATIKNEKSYNLSKMNYKSNDYNYKNVLSTNLKVENPSLKIGLDKLISSHLFILCYKLMWKMF